MISLRARVVFSATGILILFIILTSLALEHAIRDSVQSAREQRLQGQIFLLMAAGEEDEQGLVFPKSLAEPRLYLPNSGLYAQVLNALGDPVWRSPSWVDSKVPTPLPLAPGQHRFLFLHDQDHHEYFVLAYGVSWATGPVPRDYTFVVAEDSDAFRQEVYQFRASLATWLGAMAMLLLGALTLVLRWGLKPLRHMAREVAAVESGRQSFVQGVYPSEIRSLTNNLNALLAHERARQQRLDNTLGDLAHSLKTPLAVLHGALAEHDLPGDFARLCREQLSRMDAIVGYQLQRARAQGQETTSLCRTVPLPRLVERLLAALGKVYRDKNVQIERNLAPGTEFRGIEGDLMEMLGNLLENAFKWCRSRVRITARDTPDFLRLVVEDDGPGIAPEQIERILQRGVRADESTPGHGIGLAIVSELCHAYGGRLQIDASPLGGARIEISIPLLGKSTAAARSTTRQDQPR